MSGPGFYKKENGVASEATLCIRCALKMAAKSSIAALPGSISSHPSEITPSFPGLSLFVFRGGAGTQVNNNVNFSRLIVMNPETWSWKGLESNLSALWQAGFQDDPEQPSP